MQKRIQRQMFLNDSDVYVALLYAQKKQSSLNLSSFKHLVQIYLKFIRFNEWKFFHMPFLFQWGREEVDIF